MAGKYKHIYEMDIEIAYDWLQVWIGANHPIFKGCTIDTSSNVCYKMNHISDVIVEEAIKTTDPDKIGISSILDAEDEENAEGMNNIDHKSETPCTIHTVVLPKPTLIDAKINSASDAMWKIVQPEDINTNDKDNFYEALPSDNHGSYKPAMLVSHESNDSIVEWTDNNNLLSGAFPDMFIFG